MWWLPREACMCRRWGEGAPDERVRCDVAVRCEWVLLPSYHDSGRSCQLLWRTSLFFFLAQLVTSIGCFRWNPKRNLRPMHPSCFSAAFRKEGEKMLAFWRIKRSTSTFTTSFAWLVKVCDSVLGETGPSHRYLSRHGTLAIVTHTVLSGPQPYILD